MKKSNVVSINTPVDAPAVDLHELVQYSLYAPSWTAYKKDKKITAAIKKLNDVADEVDAGSYNKLLLPDCPSLDKLKSYIGSVRSVWFYGRTQPWGEARGVRVGKAKDLMTTLDEFGEKQEGLKPYKEAFKAEYLQDVAKAELELNNMFNPDDYPALDEVVDRFDLKLSTMPLANVRDVRLLHDVPPHIKADIEAAMQQEFEKSYNTTAKIAFERLLKPVRHMAKTLRAYDKKEVTKLYDSVVENVRHIGEMASTLNITNDPDLDKLAQAALDLVDDLSAKDLKESEGHLRVKAKAAEDLAARIAKFIP